MEPLDHAAGASQEKETDTVVLSVPACGGAKRALLVLN